MKGKLYLIGGGEIRLKETYLIDQEILQLAEPGATFVFFPTAANDNENYIQAIKEVYGERFNIVVPTKELGGSYARSAINKASVVYLGGGEAKELMNVFSEWKLEPTLRIAYEKGVHVVGMSAGAQALSKFYFHSVAEPTQIKKGWGWVEATTLVHAQADNVSMAQASLRNLKNNQEACPLIAIAERTALRIDDKGQQKVGEGKSLDDEGLCGLVK